MISKKLVLLAALSAMVLLALVAAQCGAPAAPQKVVETVVVKETVEVTKEVEKVVTKEVEKVVEKQVEVTPTPVDTSALRDAVGVKALDDTTLQITLKEPAGYFPSIAALWVTYPQPQATIEELKNKWTEAGLIVTNGPYTLAEWSHGASMKLVKNPLWVDASKVQIETIQGPIIGGEESTAMAMYEANEIDMMADPGAGVPLPDMDRVKSDPTLSKELFTAPRLCTYYYGFVTTKPPFDKVEVRKAFAMAIDRQSLIDNVTKGGQLPAHSFAPAGIFGNVADDKTIGSWMVMDNYADQLKQAQQMLADAGYPEGQGIDIVMMYNTLESHAQIMQAVQAMWAEAFPKAKLTIENQEWGVYLKTLLPESPDAEKPNVFRMGWCADYPDENNWLNEVFNSKSTQNYEKYNNPKFDELVLAAAKEPDQAKRKDMYKQAETILMDDQPMAPIYYYTYVRLYKPWLTKVVMSPVGGDPVDQWQIDAAAKAASFSTKEDVPTLDTAIVTEPPTLDPALATDTQSVWMDKQLFVGLLGFDEKANVVPALAKEWSVSPDGLTWTFKLRDDIHWVHRDPTSGEFEDLGVVTAKDVEYGIKRTLDPATASDYAYVLYIIKGAEEFNTAK
jgi:ABC-type oligopeptide transport system substrate-binding subunit